MVGGKRDLYMNLLNVNAVNIMGSVAAYVLQNINPILTALMLLSVITFNIVKVWQIIKKK